MTLNGAVRCFLANTFPRQMGNVIVTEFPKSGGTWVGQLLAHILEINFPRNKFPQLSRQVLHCHRTWFLDETVPVTVLRDGRDVYISYFYHSLFENDLKNQEHVRKTRRKFRGKREVDIKNDLADFIEYVHTPHLHGNLNWSAFVESRLGRGTHFVRYENLLDKPLDTLNDLLVSYGIKNIKEKQLLKAIDAFDFSKQRQRQGKALQNRWLRVGKKHQWKTEYSQDARDAFNQFNFSTLQKLGYASSIDWK